MKKHTVPTFLCAGLLLVSVLVRALLEWTPFVQYFSYFMWIHVAVIVLAVYGAWVLRKSRGIPGGEFSAFLRGLPIWLAALALPVALAVAPMFSLVGSSQGTTPDGQAVRSKSWSQEGDRYYVVLNRKVKVEIAAAEYVEANRQGSRFFCSAWILFSYLALVIWHYNRGREGGIERAPLERASTRPPGRS